MVRDSLLQRTSTVSVSQTTNEKPFAWDKVASGLPSVAFLNKNGGGRSSFSSTVSRRGEQSKQGRSQQKSLQFKRLNFLRKEVTIRTFGEAN